MGCAFSVFTKGRAPVPGCAGTGKRGVPPPPQSDSASQARIATAVHVALYLLLILLPITGVVAWAGPSGNAAGLHSLLRLVLFGLVALHFLAALVGQFGQKTGVIGPMMKAAD